LKPDRLGDKPPIRDESSGSISAGQQKAEFRPDRQSATYTAKEWFEKGRVMDDESEAEIECYQKAIETDPTFAPAYYCLGAIYFRQANYEAAYEEFTEFLKCASEVDRQAYDIYVYCSPSDVERLSEEKPEGEVPAEEVKEEMPRKGETETPAEGETEPAGEASDETGDEVSEKVMTVVRFLPVDGHIMVPVVLNAFLEARVLVDTGAGITVFSRELAQKLQLEEEPGHSITLKTMSTDIQAQSATLDSIQLGNLIQNNLRVAITDLPRGGERKFDGILGMDFMNKYKIQIDNENKRILLSPIKKTS
jgi:predicted aspartyl protease